MIAVSLLIVVLLSWMAGAKLRLASYYGDHMVLQKKPGRAVIWGYGDPDANIMLTVSQDHNIMKKTAAVKGSGIWKVFLKPMAQGGPFHIQIQQRYKKAISSVTLKDVYFGDVWFCSGQSNMEMTVSQIFNASKELEEASRYPLVRVFSAGLVLSEVELQDLANVSLPWSIPTAQNLGHGDFTYFSAVCWLFGRYLFEKIKYPIGLVDTSTGGTTIETWSSKRVLQECAISGYPEKVLSAFKGAGPIELSVLWNAMIHPFLNMTLKGVIWYQGETNLNLPLYSCTFPALIEDWRKAFHKGSAWQTKRYFPFGFVQLSTDHYAKTNDNLARIRWLQTAGFGYVPNKKMLNTFMAVTIDLGDEDSPYGSAHPRDKQTVASRLLLGALALAYGDKSIIFQGPYPEKVKVDVAQKSIMVFYKGSILLRHRNNKTFEVCCSESEESSCNWSPVSIASSSSHSVILHNPGCPNNTAGLRYAWHEWPCEYKQCPIYNTQGLPAPPFTTLYQNNSDWNSPTELVNTPVTMLLCLLIVCPLLIFFVQKMKTFRERQRVS